MALNVSRLLYFELGGSAISFTDIRIEQWAYLDPKFVGEENYGGQWVLGGY